MTCSVVQTKLVPLSCFSIFHQGQSVLDFSFPIHIKRTTLNGNVALESQWSPWAPDDRAPTPDVELQRLPVFVCRTLWNMWFWLQNVLLLNNVSALELGTLHKDYFVPWCPHGKSLPHCTHTHTHACIYSGDDDISKYQEPILIRLPFFLLVCHIKRALAYCSPF